MTNSHGGYGDGDPSDKRSASHEPGCNDNDDPDRDNTLSLALFARRRSNGVVALVSKQTAVRRDAGQLRDLAGWYRGFAMRAGSPNIWEGRLWTAGDLEGEAGRIERLYTAMPLRSPSSAAGR